MPGGDLTVTLASQTTLLTGPAVIVAEGQLTPAWLRRLTRGSDQRSVPSRAPLPPYLPPYLAPVFRSPYLAAMPRADRSIQVATEGTPVLSVMNSMYQPGGRHGGLRRGDRLYLAACLGADGQVDQPLGVVEGVGGDARADDAGPLDVPGLGGADGETWP